MPVSAACYDVHRATWVQHGGIQVATDSRIVVFVHGWSVRNTNTYGELPARLRREAARSAGLRLDVRNIWLGKYISFRDEVRMEDLSRAFQSALEDQLGKEIGAGRRFVCITHSTGGPVVRDWWSRLYPSAEACPMSHLIMLAPPNSGCALVQLGKSRISRIKAWFEGVEPGTGLLDWLELGSPESWDMNLEWIRSKSSIEGDPPVFPFVLTGQSIDRSLYDHLNSYTDEAGTDGVIRAAAANLNMTYIRLEQEPPAAGEVMGRKMPATRLRTAARPKSSPRTAFALIEGRSHSGSDMGILRSVRNDGGDHPTVNAILRCLAVTNAGAYLGLCDEFDAENSVVHEKERVEVYKRRLMPDRVFMHDTHSMLIVRLRDDSNHAVTDFDLKLTAGQGGRVGPDFLPEGFFVDRQRNKRNHGTLTYYVNHDIMVGCEAIADPRDSRWGNMLRERQPGAESLGFDLTARPDDGFVHYHPATLQADRKNLEQLIRPDQTTLVEIVLRRVVRKGTFRLTRELDPENFTDQPPGEPIP
jgi:hypothetical protein